MSSTADVITKLLGDVERGGKEAEAKLFRRVESELRMIAKGYMRRERSDHTLQATVLVDDAFLQLLGRYEQVKDSKHFYRAAAQAMRHILVDHARRSPDAVKRPAVQDLDELSCDPLDSNLIALDEALEKLSQLSPRQGQVVELHHFGGRSLEETSVILGVSRSTTKLDWRAAKAWLHKELSRDKRDA